MGSSKPQNTFIQGIFLKSHNCPKKENWAQTPVSTGLSKKPTHKMCQRHSPTRAVSPRPPRQAGGAGVLGRTSAGTHPCPILGGPGDVSRLPDMEVRFVCFPQRGFSKL